MVVAVVEMHQVRQILRNMTRWHCVIGVARVWCVVIVLTRRARRRVGRIGSVSTTRCNNRGYMIVRVVQVVNIESVFVNVAARRRVVIRMTAGGVGVVVVPRRTPQILSRRSSRRPRRCRCCRRWRQSDRSPRPRGRRCRNRRVVHRGGTGVVAARYLTRRARRRRVDMATETLVPVLPRLAGSGDRRRRG